MRFSSSRMLVAGALAAAALGGQAPGVARAQSYNNGPNTAPPPYAPPGPAGSRAPGPYLYQAPTAARPGGARTDVLASPSDVSTAGAAPYGAAPNGWPVHRPGYGGLGSAPPYASPPPRVAAAPAERPRAGQGAVGLSAGREGVRLGDRAASDPSGMRASYAEAPAERRPAAAPTAAPEMKRPTGSAFAPDTQPYPPPPKPSRLRRFYNWLTGDDKPSERPVHGYIDPSTGRTDLPFSKPWLKPVQ